MKWGTSHFEDMKAALDYYRPYDYGTEAQLIHHVQGKLDDGEIAIGMPEIKPGQTLYLNQERRWHIDDHQPHLELQSLLEAFGATEVGVVKPVVTVTKAVETIPGPVFQTVDMHRAISLIKQVKRKMTDFADRSLCPDSVLEDADFDEVYAEIKQFLKDAGHE